MDRRERFGKWLADVSGLNPNTNVFFNAPPGIQLTYPCIIYALDSRDPFPADNFPYLNPKRYAVTIIDRDMDNLVAEKISALPGSRFDRAFITSNLCHHVYIVNDTNIPIEEEP